jgi:hypothetical protein
VPSPPGRGWRDFRSMSHASNDVQNRSAGDQENARAGISNVEQITSGSLEEEGCNK